MEKPLFTFQKNADKEKNRVIIPKFFIDKYGREFTMEIHDGFIKLIPIKKSKKGE